MNKVFCVATLCVVVGLSPIEAHTACMYAGAHEQLLRTNKMHGPAATLCRAKDLEPGTGIRDVGPKEKVMSFRDKLLHNTWRGRHRYDHADLAHNIEFMELRAYMAICVTSISLDGQRRPDREKMA
jgi:hypothetical protein